ncbi:hypothetical protein [Niallia sp. Krafla_26]|uniref:hypothetical protein n=1 Tax=Niallia sp. Krafla_26 TaxID=3064703 RepID=UPI003D17FC0D
MKKTTYTVTDFAWQNFLLNQEYRPRLLKKCLFGFVCRHRKGVEKLEHLHIVADLASFLFK